VRVIIAGSRTIHDYAVVEHAVKESKFDVTEVVCGGASGVDTLGFTWATRHEIPVKMMPADWKRHGRSAGPLRNGEMARYADALILVWDGISRGSSSMKQQMTRLGKHIFEVIV